MRATNSRDRSRMVRRVPRFRGQENEPLPSRSQREKLHWLARGAKKRVVKRSWGFSAGKRNVNYSETEEHKSRTVRLQSGFRGGEGLFD